MSYFGKFSDPINMTALLFYNAYCLENNVRRIRKNLLLNLITVVSLCLNVFSDRASLQEHHRTPVMYAVL